MRASLICVFLAGVAAAAPADWLVKKVAAPAASRVSADGAEVELSNGLIRRVWRVRPDAATVAFDNLMTGQTILRGVKPEAQITVSGRKYDAGGLTGQPDYAYLRPEWTAELKANPEALHFTRYETGKAVPRMEWQRGRYASSTAWPPAGASVTLHFGGAGLAVAVHYEMFDGMPVLVKWITVRNEGPQAVTLDTFTSEMLAVADEESTVEHPPIPPSVIQAFSDYSFGGMDLRNSGRTIEWAPDPQYTTQVNYSKQSPVLLLSRPSIGPGISIAPGGNFESFRTFELIHDSTDRERRGLALRRMFRAMAPWVTENPILMHVRRADDESVKTAIDQCAEVGFEMVIMSFGSGFNIESTDPAYAERIRRLVEYAHSKGVELGGYSLLASRKVSAEDDVINPKTGTTGGAIFGNSPCLGSRWGAEYFRKLKSFIEATGLDILEHDGSYPGDVCASTKHPGHRGLEDSQWTQWRTIADFYAWSRARGVYLNVPDSYFLAGSNKTGMGYREVNWSLPREQQIILGRQNIFDGTWEKTPSMGWMFVPLVQYHGGGAAATLEPLKDHLDAYEHHLAQNFGAGVQACYRGPRLFDSPETKAVVKRWVDFYKAHRTILDSDVIHLRRPDARDWDGILHVNPNGAEKGLAMIYNPLNQAITRRIRLPLYYTGLDNEAVIQQENGTPMRYRMARDYAAEVEVKVPAGKWTWLVVK